jgi:hypothetical protein
MHHHSIASLLLASANVFSLAIAQASSASADLGDLLIDSGASVGVVSGTATATATSEPVVTQTVTSSQTSPQSQESASPNDGDSSEYGDEQLYAACFPGIFNNQTDWTAPCPAMQAIEGQCTWGPDALDAVKRVIASQGSDRGTIDETWEMQPPELMRACICSSQYVDMLLGCGACLAGYGLRQSSVRRLGFTSNATIMSEWSKLYCDASKTPNEDSFSDAFDCHGFDQQGDGCLDLLYAFCQFGVHCRVAYGELEREPDAPECVVHLLEPEHFGWSDCSYSCCSKGERRRRRWLQ